MRDFNDLTFTGQVRRLRALAKEALAEFGIEVAHLRYLGETENTNFQVRAAKEAAAQDATDLFEPGRFVVRVHLPNVHSRRAIESELRWVKALRQEANLPVPEAVATPGGELTVEVEMPGVPEPRTCTLLRWVRGRMFIEGVRPHHFHALGRLMAHIHQHANDWSPPVGFERPHWNWEGLFGDGAGFQHAADELWAMVPKRHVTLLRKVADVTGDVMGRLGQGSDVYGLLHGDLDVDGNILYYKGEARAVDFDDCGFGHWLYDFAIAMYAQKEAPLYRENLDSLIAGYRDVRDLPDEQLKHLGAFLAARHATMVLWGLDSISMDEPGMKERVDRWLDWNAKHIKASLAGVR